MSLSLARELMARCDELGAISEEPGRLTRTFASPAMQRANKLVASWMREAGMQTSEDAAFNLIGRWECAERGAKTFLLGSHLDTVRDAGKYDGPLGVLTAIAAVQSLRERGVKLPFHIEVIGFSDEEGVRYQTAYLGSSAFAGTLKAADLARIEEKQIVNARRREKFLGYAEVHIEQGPVLEEKKLAVGIVSAIAGQTRRRIRFFGQAGHAGTVPMDLRRDALCAAAEFVLAVERKAKATPGLVATVGEIEVPAGASNVIPGEVSLTLDIRHADDLVRGPASAKLIDTAKDLADARFVDAKWIGISDTRAVACDKQLTSLLIDVVKTHQTEAPLLCSGAGHDAVVLSQICPVAMLFVRCKDGISHNPAESVTTEDVRVAIDVLTDFLTNVAAVCDRR